MSEMQSPDYGSELPANLEDILPIAAAGDTVAREYFASRCSIERHIQHPVVRGLAKQVIRREFDPTSLVSCLPPRDELRNVRFGSGSLLSGLVEGASLFREALAKDTPLRVRMVPEVPELHFLAIDLRDSIKDGLKALNRFASAQDAPKFLSTDLRVAMLFESNQTVLEFEAALPPKLAFDSALAFLASSATRKVLHLCLAAAITRVACSKLKIPDSVLKGILSEGAAHVQEDPWRVLDGALLSRCRALNSEPGVEVLGALNDQHLSEILTARNGLERGKRQIQKELAALEKREAQRRALQEKLAVIGQRAKMDPEALQIAVGELGEAMRSPGSRYGRAGAQEIEGLCVNLMEKVVTLAEADLQFEAVICWSQQLRNGALVQDLKVSRVP
jgi:hypothetical protein